MKQSRSVFLAGLLLAGLYFSSRYNYLLFHSLAELFSIVTAWGIFMIGWSSRQFLRNSYLMLLGIAYLFIGGVDLLHTLAYSGMRIFPGNGTNLATQLWVAARFLESVSLALAPLLLRRQLRTSFIMVGYATVTGLLLYLIFLWPLFPICFVEGVGLTRFKLVSEYVICGILLGAICLLLRDRTALDEQVRRYLAWSMALGIVSELSFTLYVDAYGLSNLVGHYLKILRFYLVYRAIIQTGLTRPFALLFRELQQGEERYHSLFTHMINGVAQHQIVLDPAGNPVDYIFVEVNRAFEHLTGLSAANLIGKRVTEVIPGIESDPADWIGVYGRVALKGEGLRFENYSAHLQKWYSVIAYRSQPGCFVTVFEDITDRKRVEADLSAIREQLLRANENLEHKVQERTAKLQETIADLEQFSYSIVHDMRAPLRSMNSFATLLLEDCRETLDEDHLDYLDRIRSAAQRLDGLIRDVLSYSKVARAELKVEPVDLDLLVRDIVRGYPCFQSDQAQIEVAAPLQAVLGNRALLTQCISNLLGNAIKFVSPERHGQVRLWTEECQQGWVRVCVQDNGIGIESGQLDRIWRIFERLHHQHEYPGTGIGLSVVKRAVERMAGTVGVTSQPGQGSTFWFQLPAAQSAP